MNCNNLINISVGDRCESVTKGYKDTAVIINFEDVDFDSITRDEANRHIVTALSLKDGKYGYKIKQRSAKKFNGTKSSMTSTDYQNEMGHTIQFFVPDADATTVNGFLQPLKDGALVVVILERTTQGTDGKSAFEVYGLDSGCTVATMDKDGNGDSGHGALVAMTETSPSVMTFLFNESYDATKLIVDGLVKNS